MLFKEIITVYSENKIKPINKFCGQNKKLLRWYKLWIHIINAGFLGFKEITHTKASGLLNEGQCALYFITLSARLLKTIYM